MAIPDHEQLKTPYGGAKRARKSDGRSDPLQVMKRIVQCGQMMDVQQMRPIEIYQWNMDPDNKDIANWGYSIHMIYRLCARARRLGADLLGESAAEVTRSTLRHYQGLYRQSVAGEDYRTAFWCVTAIAKIRGLKIGASHQKLTDESGHAFKFKEKAPAAPLEATDGVFNDVGDDGMVYGRRTTRPK